MNKKTKLKIDKNGYVALLRCGKGHSGNTRYVRDGAYCQCQGCGTFLSVEFCITEQAKAKATKGENDK